MPLLILQAEERELPDTLLDVPVALLDLAEAREEHQPHGGLQHLQHAVNEHPDPQRPVALLAGRPVHAEEDAAGDRDEDAGDAPEEHHNLDEPGRLLWVPLHHVDERVRVFLLTVVRALEVRTHPLLKRIQSAPYTLHLCHDRCLRRKEFTQAKHLGPSFGPVLKWNDAWVEWLQEVPLEPCME